MKYLLYNPLANNNSAKIEAIEYAKEKGFDEVKDATEINYVDFFKSLNKEDEVTIAGGDGTINYLINSIGDYKLMNKLYFHPCGTGNDFYHDVLGKEYKEDILLNSYIENLPTVEVFGKTCVCQKFINGIGYGIDGYCCEVGDKLKAKSDKPVNYTAIAIKGLLFHFKRVKAKIIVDGVSEEAKHVWLAPTMKGRFYGGGMMVAPSQDRTSDSVTTVTYKSASKLKALIVFPSIFKGEHVKHTKVVKTYVGKEIEVIFNRPTSLQIDGETVLNVTSYKVHA